MRRRKRDLTARVNGDIAIDPTPDSLTSYAGLELFSRYLRRRSFVAKVKEALGDMSLSGDYGTISMILLVVGLLLIGARRLAHVDFVRFDPILCRFALLRHLPHQRTLSRWLKQFTIRKVARLQRLNELVVLDTLRRTGVGRVTIDIDGTVVSTGLQVKWAKRGYNPHRRKVPSYYPIAAHVAQTGQVFAVKNRPGNVHDGKRSLEFLRTVFDRLGAELGDEVLLECRLDGAFFRQDVIAVLERRSVDYAVKVPLYPWLNLKPVIAARKRWHRINAEVSYFETEHWVKTWGRSLWLVIYRKKVKHKTRKNFQLDLFNPDDGYYEYSTVLSNKEINGADLWHFMAGRGAQEKTFAELKDGLAFASVPTNEYGANSAWQQLSVLTLNLLRDFQITAGAEAREQTSKHTYRHRLASIKTIRFEWLNVAGRLIRPNGVRRLRLASSPGVRDRFAQIADALANVA